MSVRVMTLVWAIDLPDSEKIVLLALADSANDEGHCWPGMKSLVRKCSKSDRTIQTAIQALCDKGHLTRREVPGKGCNYTVHPIATPEAASPRSDCAPPPKPVRETPEATSGKPSLNRQGTVEAKASYERVIDAWNAMAKRHKLPTVRILDNGRKQMLRLRLKEHGEDVLLEAIKLVGQSPWLRGEGRDGNWRPTLDFVLQPSSLRKIVEGAYGADPEKRGQKPLNREELCNAIRFHRDRKEFDRVAELEQELRERPPPRQSAEVASIIRGAVNRAA